ncbi:ComEA family DNA-binding protein [Actinomadura sp. WMMB 499]|uniref:ComEA family DNA-binding protein n=1 Tax=Actinomadura sp. WMMB 499 TaxID=1219491 RepID=UPI001246689C|nr:ComEA family DNA-binding protein [Actinomadura sp. WMMB 499]QFG25631.1 ComEA family DNA-binding protein [Actinomadura sp. WMMB 499]
MKASDRLQALVDRVRVPAAPPQEPPAARLRAAPDRPGVRALVIVAVIAAVVAAGYLWASRPRPHAAPATDASVATLAAGPSAPSAPSESAAPTGTVVVHVLGKVQKPGVITLPAGSRVAEALEAAGGVRRGAKTGPLNLARKVVDGEQIPVGVPAPTPPPGVPPPGAPPPGAPSSDGVPVNLNTATVDQLDELPGVGPVLAGRIIEYRTANGGFRSVDQLQDVNGIGAARFADLKSRVRT